MAVSQSSSSAWLACAGELRAWRQVTDRLGPLEVVALELEESFLGPWLITGMLSSHLTLILGQHFSFHRGGQCTNFHASGPLWSH